MGQATTSVYMYMYEMTRNVDNSSCEYTCICDPTEVCDNGCVLNGGVHQLALADDFGLLYRLALFL